MRLRTHCRIILGLERGPVLYMTRNELIRLLVLNEIADDYEEPEYIHGRLAGLGPHCGLPIELPDVRQALLDLVGLGCAKAYNLWRNPAEGLRGVPPLERVDEYYYWITDQGRVVHSSFNSWPFDEEGKIRPGWCAPTE